MSLLTLMCPPPPPFVWLHCADRFTTVLLSYLQNSTMSCERFKSVWCVQVSWVHFDGLWQYCHGVLIVSWSTYNLINDSNPILLSFLVIWHRSESPAHTVYRQKKKIIFCFSLFYCKSYSWLYKDTLSALFTFLLSNMYLQYCATKAQIPIGLEQDELLLFIYCI